MPCLLKTLLKDEDETLLGHAHVIRGEALGLDGFGPRPTGFGISCFSLGKALHASSPRRSLLHRANRFGFT